MRADSSLVTYKGENNNTAENGWRVPQWVLCLWVSQKHFFYAPQLDLRITESILETHWKQVKSYELSEYLLALRAAKKQSPSVSPVIVNLDLIRFSKFLVGSYQDFFSLYFCFLEIKRNFSNEVQHRVSAHKFYSVFQVIHLWTRMLNQN